MLFVCDPRFLHKHCVQFLLGVKIAPRETETTFMQNFGETKKSIMVCYGIFWSGQLAFSVFLLSKLWSNIIFYPLYNYTKKPDKKKFIFQP